MKERPFNVQTLSGRPVQDPSGGHVHKKPCDAYAQHQSAIDI